MRKTHWLASGNDSSGVRVSAHVPGAASMKQNALVRLGTRRDYVAPVWGAVTLIPDEVTKAANGQIVPNGGDAVRGQAAAGRRILQARNQPQLIMAVTLTIQELAAYLRVTTSETQVVPGPWVTILYADLAAATKWVERRAPGAPDDSMNAAVQRICGYWSEAPGAGARRFGYNAWLNSGAGQILAPFIERRAEAV